MAKKKVTLKKKTQKKTVKRTVKRSAGLKIGAKAPTIELPATGYQNIRLTQFQGQKIVLFFYPKDMTPGCTTEGRDFTKLKREFSRNNTVVLGISRDSVASHEKFKTKESYTIDLISDPDERLCRAFGVMKEKNMYGRKVFGIERSTFVIDESGVLVKEWRGVSVPEHAAEVLEYIKNLE